MRNCQELGINLQKICSRLLNNEDLMKLLYYTDQNPLGHEITPEIIQNEISGKLLTVVPYLKKREDQKSQMAIFVPKGSIMKDNGEFRSIDIIVDIMVPLEQWVIQDSNLRPFAILGNIQGALSNKTINGLGKIECGDFELADLTDEISLYRQWMSITTYD